jgi:hypothetical protein
MAEPPDPGLVEELYGAPPGEFIARRDAAAKSLRSSGDRAGADAVKKLRRPSVSAAAVNRLARDSADDVSSLLAAGEALRQAQLGGGSDRDTIRSAAADERAAVERLVGEAGAYGLSGSALEEVRSTLHAAALDEDLREDVRRGVLVEPRQAVGLGPFGAAVARPRARRGPASRGGNESIRGGPGGTGSAEAAASPKRAGRRKTTAAGPAAALPSQDPAEAAADDRADAAAARAAAAAERAAEKERRRAAKERVKVAKAAVRDAEKAAKAAQRERDQAAKALSKAEREAAAAAETLDRRRADLEAAESA